MSKQEATRLADAQASAVPLHDELHWMGRLYGFPIMCRGAERIAALESARDVQDAALAVARNDFRELALRAEKLESALEQARGALEWAQTVIGRPDDSLTADLLGDALRAIEETRSKT